MRPITLALILGSLAAVATGCMNGGAIPLTGGLGRGMSSLPSAHGVTIQQFADLPRGGINTPYNPTAVTAGPGGLLWVTDPASGLFDVPPNAVVAIATSGSRLHLYDYKGPGHKTAAFADIVEGSDGALWIADSGNGQILRLTAQGTYTRFALPRDKGPYSPEAIVNGPDKALWFTENTGLHGYFVGRITTSGSIRRYSIPYMAQDISTGPDGALWFTEPYDSRIGRITTGGKITQYSKGIQTCAVPYSIVPGPDGALWFTEQGCANIGRIGRITTSGRVTEFSKGITTKEMPQDLAAGPDGAIWFTEYEPYDGTLGNDSKIGRITMQGKINEYSKRLYRFARPMGITAGPDGRMWFVESFNDKMGRVTL